MNPLIKWLLDFPKLVFDLDFLCFSCFFLAESDFDIFDEVFLIFEDPTFDILLPILVSLFPVFDLLLPIFVELFFSILLELFLAGFPVFDSLFPILDDVFVIFDELLSFFVALFVFEGFFSGLDFFGGFSEPFLESLVAFELAFELFDFFDSNFLSSFDLDFFAFLEVSSSFCSLFCSADDCDGIFSTFVEDASFNVVSAAVLLSATTSSEFGSIFSEISSTASEVSSGGSWGSDAKTACFSSPFLPFFLPILCKTRVKNSSKMPKVTTK